MHAGLDSLSVMDLSATYSFSICIWRLFNDMERKRTKANFTVVVEHQNDDCAGTEAISSGTAKSVGTSAMAATDVSSTDITKIIAATAAAIVSNDTRGSNQKLT